MDHHRLGITALILLIVITILYAHERTVAPLEPRPAPSSVAVTPQVITHGDRTRRQITFTFDGGEGNQSAEGILATLAKHRVRGTFFLTGRWIARNQELAARIKAAGHEIYNHSMNHPHFTTLTDDDIRAQLRRMDAVAEGVTGSTTRPYFRPPYGDYDERVVDLAAREGYHTVMWSADAGDWMESEGYTADQVRTRIMNASEPGAIILMHIGDTITGAILDDVFTTLEGQGYELTSLSEALVETLRPDLDDTVPLKIGW